MDRHQERVSIPYERESISKVAETGATRRAINEVSIPYERESISKAVLCFALITVSLLFVSIPYERESISKEDRMLQQNLGNEVSIPYERESISKETPFCTQSGRGSGYPKTKRELRGAFFTQKFIPKIPRTLVNIDPNAIFWQDRCGSQSASMFLDELSRAGGRGTNRVCFYKYTHNSEKCQIFCVLFRNY